MLTYTFLFLVLTYTCYLDFIFSHFHKKNTFSHKQLDAFEIYGRASRGIDFAKGDHVVLFDFPRDPSEYVRRVGRTARGAGGKGKAFVYVVGKQVSLARRIIERNKKGHPLHNVPSAYELMS